MANMNAKDIMESARLRVFNRHPYISAVLMSLRLVEKKGLGTLAVDAGWRCYYDPDVVEKWGIELLAGVVAHEVWHVLRDHFARFANKMDTIVVSPDTGSMVTLANLAEDLEINSDLTKAQWKLPDGGLQPAQFKFAEGLLAEEYYDLLLKKIPMAKSVIQGMGGRGTGKGHCGSCTGHAHEGEDGDKDGSGKSKDKDGKSDSKGDVPDPISQWEQEVLRRQVAQETSAQQKSKGDVPAGLAAWAEKELAPPTIDWRKQLAAHVRRTITEAAGAVDHTYRKQSRRGAGLRLSLGYNAPILPALYRPVPNIGLVLDVSGSMDGGPAEAARSEIMGVVKAIGCPVEVYVADTRVAGKRKVAGAADIAKLGETLGGTDMAHAITEVDQMGKHDVLIVLTDGYTGWHTPGSVKVRVLAAITPGGEKPPDYVPYVEMKA